MRFYVTEQVSPNIAETPEGFLVCQNVPITRTGALLYNAREVPLQADAAGVVEVNRTEEDVFNETTMKSFEGKPLTLNHPDDFVTPDNWKSLSVGIVQNVRRGENGNRDCMVADLLVTTTDAIQLVKAGLREVSCGYDAEYEQTEAGKGRQTNIVGNHVALVPRGRAGSRCAIQDSHECNGCGKCTCKTKTKDHKEEPPMKFRDRLKELFKAFPAVVKTIDEMSKEDEEELKKKATEDEEEMPGWAREMKKSLDALEESDKKLHEQMDCFGKKTKDEEEAEAKKKKEEEETEDLEGYMSGGEFHPIRGSEGYKKSVGDPSSPSGKARSHMYRHEGDAAATKARDEAMKALFQDTAARTEILKPGHNIPTFDAATAAKTVDSIKREVLQALYATEDGKKAIEPFTGGPVTDFAALPAPTVDAAFIGASEIVKVKNNAGFRVGVTVKDFGKTTQVAEINKTNRAFWAKPVTH